MSHRWFGVLFLLAYLVFPLALQPHGGRTDSLGCHHDRKRGGYHCHSSPLAGRSFTSKAEALKALQTGKGGAAKSVPSKEGRAPEQRSAETGSIKASEAKDHIGEKATVCGKVASTRYAARSQGRPTFLNLDKPYPNQVFTVVIWGSNRAKFDTPEVKYREKRICVNGKISSYRGVPQIIADDLEQIKLQSKGKK